MYFQCFNTFVSFCVSSVVYGHRLSGNKDVKQHMLDKELASDERPYQILEGLGVKISHKLR